MRGSLLGWFASQKPRSAMQPVQSLASSLTLSAGNAAPRLVRDNDNAVRSLSLSSSLSVLPARAGFVLVGAFLRCPVQRSACVHSFDACSCAQQEHVVFRLMTRNVKSSKQVRFYSCSI